jgi:coiled-coil domain-containing protein 115
VTSGPEGTAFSVVELSTLGKDGSVASEGVHKDNAGPQKTGISAADEIPDGDTKTGGEEDEQNGDAEREKKTTKSKDPVRMFGILTPQALRLAQGGAIKMVEEVIPKLASIDAEMKEVEIKIRRARKHRVKAEAAEKTVVGERREEGVVS